MKNLRSFLLLFTLLTLFSSVSINGQSDFGEIVVAKADTSPVYEFTENVVVSTNPYIVNAPVHERTEVDPFKNLMKLNTNNLTLQEERPKYILNWQHPNLSTMQSHLGELREKLKRCENELCWYKIEQQIDWKEFTIECWNDSLAQKVIVETFPNGVERVRTYTMGALSLNEREKVQYIVYRRAPYGDLFREWQFNKVLKQLRAVTKQRK